MICKRYMNFLQKTVVELALLLLMGRLRYPSMNLASKRSISSLYSL